MASLEYLTQNSLIAYPFKGRVAVSINNQNPIQDDWFLDILFISYVDNIRNVYISKLEKTLTGELRITFSNGETLQELLQNAITIPSSELVNHLYNSSKSFASYSCEDFAVKFVFGAGLIDKEVFTQLYTLEEAELASAAVILRTPDIDNLTFESYDNRTQLNPTGLVKNYTPIDDIPKVKPRYNSTFTSTGINEGRLDVSSGAGEGLYNNCPDPSENVFSLNRVAPDSSGALFLKTSTCYTANVLSNNDVAIYGEALEKYRNFVTHLSPDPADDVLFNAVSPQHSFVIENFCKPKCPPENMAAFAYYLNRVADGVIELDKIAAINKETHGEGTVNADVFQASGFCVQNNPFLRCISPDTGESLISCGLSFIRYFHEGRVLQLFYDNTTIREYTIIEVIDDNTVRLDSIPTASGSTLFFRVIDNGVISNINCAVANYNREAEAFSSIYFKVKYTTAESFNEDGAYSTYFAVTVAVFNPSQSNISVLAEFITSLTKQGDYKIRTQQGIQISNTPTVTLPCRGYAFIETVYYVPCDQQGGNLNINLYNVTTNPTTQIGETFTVENISGAPCKDTTLTNTILIRLLDADFNTFNYEIAADPATTNVTVTTPANMPEWMNLVYNPTTKKITLAPQQGHSAPSQSRVSTFTYNQYVAAVLTVTTVIIDYVAKPSISFPLSSKYPVANPLIAAKSVSYTATSPLIQIAAKNMTRIGSNFPGDAGLYLYTLTGALPQGLTFNSDTGVVIGQINQSVANGTIYNLEVNARNPAGFSLAPQTLSIAVNSIYLPTIAFQNPPIGNIFNISNANTYTSSTPVYNLTTTGNPSLYKLTPTNLPAGLSFNQATGKITGKATASTNQNNIYSLVSENSRGESNSLTFQLNYTAYLAPVFTYPEQNIVVTGYTTQTTTEDFPLISITATQMYGGTNNFDPRLTNSTRNKFTAVNLPAGLFIGQYTGRIYGTLSSSVYANYPANATIYNPIIVTATNSVGTANPTLSITLAFSSVPIPNILSITSGTVLTVIKGTEYTDTLYFLQLFANNNPTSYSAIGLPPGLTCSNSGKITGTVAVSLPAAEYNVGLTATNAVGTSSVVPIKIIVPVAIISPAEAEIIYVDGSVTYTLENPLFTILTSGVANQPTGVSYSTSVLPSGLTLSGNKIIGKTTSNIDRGVTLTATAITPFGADTNTITLAIRSFYSITGNVTVETVPDGMVAQLQNTETLVYIYATIQNNTFNFDNIPAGNYSLRLNPEGHSSYNISYSFAPDLLTFSLTENTSHDFSAIRFYSAAGTVTFTLQGLSPSPYAGIKVIAYQNSPSVILSETYTNTNGGFTLYRLQSGLTYNVQPSTQEELLFTPETISVGPMANNENGLAFSTPAALPSITEITENHANGNFNYLISFTSETAITKLQYRFGEFNFYTDLVTVVNPVIDQSGKISLQFTEKVQGVAYKLDVSVSNVFTKSEDVGIVSFSNGAPKFAPSLVAVTPVTYTGEMRLSYIISREAWGYGDSEITGIIFKVSNQEDFSSSVDYPASFSNIYIGESLEFVFSSVIDLFSFYPDQLKYVKMCLVNNFGSSPFSLIKEGYAARPPGPVTLSDLKFVTNVENNITELYMFANISRSPARAVNEGPDVLIEYGGTQIVTTEEIKYIKIGEVNTPITLANVRVAGYNSYTGTTGVFSESFAGYLTSELAAEPIDFSLTSTSTSIVISYDITKTINNGSPVINYQINVPGVTNDWYTISSFPYTLTGVTAGMVYNVSVIAYNGYFPVYYYTKGVLVAAQPTAPFIDNVTVHAERDALNGARQIAVSFSAPSSDEGSEITNYAYSTDNGATYVPLDPPSVISPLLISRKSSNATTLDNDATYNIKLKAINAIGMGVASNSMTITLEQGWPGEVPFFVSSTSTVFTLTGTSATWTPISTGGSPVTQIAVSVAPANEWTPSLATWTEFGNPPLTINAWYTSPLTTNPLTTGEEYIIAVRAYNSYGAGNIYYQRRLLRPVPGAGTYLAASAEVYSTTPTLLGTIIYPRKSVSNLYVLDDGGAPMTGFETSIDNGVTWVPGKTRIIDFSPSTVAGLNTLYFKITNLEPATYQLRVRFINSFGAGAPSNNLTITLT